MSSLTNLIVKLVGDRDPVYNEFMLSTIVTEPDIQGITTTAGELLTKLESENPHLYLESKFIVRDIIDGKIMSAFIGKWMPITFSNTEFKVDKKCYAWHDFNLYIEADREEERLRHLERQNEY